MATIPLMVRGPNAQEQAISAVIDTGFDGSLTLQPELVTDLGLIQVGWQRGMLGDGNEVQFNVYQATVVWDSKPVDVLVAAARGGPLVGMALLDGHEVTIQAIAGGSVRIVPLESG